MSGISHKQALQWIHRRMDGLLNQRQLLALDEHLRSCDECRTYASEMELFPLHLRHEFHTRWDKKPGPSQNVMEYITTKTKNIPMTKRIFSGVKLLASAAALIALAVAINFVISQLQSTSPVTNATETVDPSSLAENRLLAFASDQNGNFDIYTMHADGSGLINLTNNAARDTNPIWSPDGKHIAFESDRDGFMQIYIMDADGSDVIQITDDEAKHKLPLNRNGTHNPWSPDSRRLIIVQEESGGETETLYSVSIDGENKIMLANGRISLVDVSWSPDGKYIAHVLNISSTPNDTYVPNIYVVEPDGSNVRELKKFLPAGEQLDPFTPYYWSSNSQSIVFPALTSDPSREAVYELDLQTNTFLNETETKPVIEDWSAEVSLILDINQDGRPFVWERSDGTSNTFEASRTWGNLCDLDFTRSPQKNFAFGVYCPNTKFNLYWTNSDGSTIKQLLTLPIDVVTGGVGNIAWSPDDQYIAFNITTANKTDMYVVKVEQMLANPSLAPVKVSVNNESYSIPSWQPATNENITREAPTPQSTSTSSSGGLLAFASDQNGNSDIYTMHADGSELTNITNSPAQDSDPIWSRDGKHIVFQSNSNSFMQIYLMDTDGSNLIQLTNDKADHELNINLDGKSNPWSPDGSKLLFLQSSSGGEIGQLYVMGIDGEHKILLASGRFSLNSVSWCPDGKHIAYVLNEASNPNEVFVTGMYVVDPDGNNSRELKNYIPQGENLGAPYYWSSDGQSIILMASRENAKQETIYEFNLDHDTLLEKNTYPRVVDWQNDISLTWVKDFVWHRSDGSTNTLVWEDSSCLVDITRSSHGNFAIGAYCPDSHKFKFYWANADGSTIKQLLDSSESALIGEIGDITWSSDDQYVAFTLAAAKTSLYILNVKDALSDSSIQPRQVIIGGREQLYTIPSWQPIP